MRRLFSLMAVFLLSGALLACGGGDDDGGDEGSDDTTTTTEEEEAADVCDDDVVDAIDDFLNSSDVPDFDEARTAFEAVADADEDLEDPVDVLLDAIDTAEDALDGVDEDDDEAVGEALDEAFEDLDLEDVLDAQLEIAEFVDDECDTDLAGDLEPEEEETTTTTEGDGGDEEDTSLDDFAAEISACEGGDMAACDQLFAITPVGSAAEDIGRTCGGLGDDTTAGQCDELFGDGGDGGDTGSGDGSLDDFAEDVAGCSSGDMAICDQLFLETPVGSEAEAFGLSCGGLRPADETATVSCVEQFG